jgi:large subunit ribosomal protein L30
MTETSKATAATEKKVKPKAKKAEAKSTITVMQTGSPMRRDSIQKEYLKGLGLGKMNRVRVLQDTPGVRGLLVKAAHMVQVIED